MAGLYRLCVSISTTSPFRTSGLEFRDVSDLIRMETGDCMKGRMGIDTKLGNANL